MSIQIAKVNCERCYNLAQDEIIISDYQGEDGKIKQEVNIGATSSYRFRNDSLYTARNEAMKALDSIARYCESRYGELGVSLEQTAHQMALSALSVCSDCDYSAPMIVNTIFGEQEKMLNEEKQK